LQLFFFIFQVPPWIIGAEKETIVQATFGKSITLVCPTTGTPKPTIQWFKHDKQLEIFDVDDQYILTDIKQTDQGIYRCIATNKAGTTHRLFNISVHSKNFFFIV
jgi:glucose dehydrogenase